MFNALLIISLTLIAATWLPLLKSSWWFVRSMDYPRLQKLVLLAIAAICTLTLWPYGIHWPFWLFTGTVAASMVYLSSLVIPYTFLGKKMVTTIVPKKHPVSCLVANVYQYNNAYHRLMAMVKDNNPDVLLLLETDDAWQSALQSLEKEYPHHVLIPQDNTYGMLFYTRNKILQSEIKHIIHDDIPSLFAKIQLPDGDKVLLACVHPKPPLPQHSKKSDDRDAEILIAGDIIKQHKGPAILMGDLNDVAWSHTTRLFLRTSQMTDPRRGRGMFNTFHAKVPFFRWPLDHIFLSTHFGVVDMKVMKNIGSDHFPILITVAIDDRPTAETLSPKNGDEEEKAEKINEGLNQRDE